MWTSAPTKMLSIYIPTYFGVLSETSVMAPTPFWNGIYPPCLSAPSEEKSNKTCRKNFSNKLSSEASQQPEADVGDLSFFVTYSKSFP